MLPGQGGSEDCKLPIKHPGQCLPYKTHPPLLLLSLYFLICVSRGGEAAQSRPWWLTPGTKLRAKAGTRPGIGILDPVLALPPAAQRPWQVRDTRGLDELAPHPPPRMAVTTRV